MTPEQTQAAIIAAVLAAVLATIASVTAMVRMLPGILQKREAEREARYQDELKEREIRREKELAEMRSDFDQSKANLTMIATISESLKAMTAALIANQAQGLERDKIIVANTNAVGDVTEALADMAERLGVLFHTGTPNVVKKLDEIASSIHAIDTKGNILDILMDIRDRLSSLETQVKEKIKQAEKHISKPMPPVTQEMLDSASDGKPQA